MLHGDSRGREALPGLHVDAVAPEARFEGAYLAGGIFFRFSSWVEAVRIDRAASSFSGSYARIVFHAPMAAGMSPCGNAGAPFPSGPR